MTANTPKMVGRTRKQLSTLTRAKFGPGMLLQHDDLEQMTDYTRELSRLLFRSFFGCGVVCGLVVKIAPPKCGPLRITVKPGVALDCEGDPIFVPTEQTIDAGDCDDGITGADLWVVLCGTSKSCAPRRSACDADGDDTTDCIATRERDAFEIRVMTGEPECGCRCPEPKYRTRDDEGEDEEAGREGENGDTNGARADDGDDEEADSTEHDCACVAPSHPCYKDHYDGECCSGCGCDCQSGGKSAGSSCCDCVLLARLEWQEKDNRWRVNHGYRRFIRPVLMRDPRDKTKDDECYAKQKAGSEKQKTNGD